MKHIILVSLILLGVLCISVGSQEQQRRRKRPHQGRPYPRRPYQGRPYRRRPAYQYDYYDDYDDDYDDEPLPPRRYQKQKPKGASATKFDRDPGRGQDRDRDRVQDRVRDRDPDRVRDRDQDREAELEREKELERFRQYEKDKAESSCPEPTGFFPDAAQCDKYYECTNWKMVTRLCADGLAFVEGAPKLEKCDYIHTVDCKERPALQEPQPNANCLRLNGYFPHAECDKFYQCGGGVSTLHQCPTGLVFSNITGTCDYPDPAKRLSCKFPNLTSTYYNTEEWLNPKNETAGEKPPRRKFIRRTTTTTPPPPEEESEESAEKSEDPIK